MLGLRADQPGSDDSIAIVEDGGLAGSDTVNRLVELEPKALLGRVDARPHGRGAVPQLDVGTRRANVESARHFDRCASERLAWSHDDDVRARVGTQRIERLGSCDAKTLSLT